MKFFDRNGEPLRDVMEWHQLITDHAYRLVAHTRITSAADPTVRVLVLTQWFGLDTGFVWERERPPMLFDTLTSNTLAHEVTCDRWPNEQAARIGHAELVALGAELMRDPVITDLNALGDPATASDWVGAPLAPPAEGTTSKPIPT